jgi:serpin B
MNRLAILLVFLSLATACSMGCRKGAETAAKPAEDELPCDKGTDPASPAEPNLGEYQPGVVSADVKALAQGNNQFAFDLYARLAKQGGNMAFSPYSISSALAMT